MMDFVSETPPISLEHVAYEVDEKIASNKYYMEVTEERILLVAKDKATLKRALKHLLYRAKRREILISAWLELPERMD